MSRGVNTVENIPAGIENLQTNVSGYRAHYLKAGKGPPVVLLHGGASDSRDWLRTMTALSLRYTLYAPDLLGFGQNERNSEGYYLSEFCTFVLGFMDSLGLERPALVGHSFGGRVCLDMALKHPENVGKLVLADAAGLGKVSRVGTTLLTGFWVARKLFRIPQPFPKFLAREGDDPNWACVDELPNLKMPTLIIWKRYDLYYPLYIARRAADLIPEARLVILPGYGHAPHGRTNREFNRHLLEFLEKTGT
ncbi:MAG TPA: alpha/beta fold hydrolase [Dehalococcoidia bacterium]|nr:alpha/beta fold hydrolase [Dehalococcoidia bacterium]